MAGRIRVSLAASARSPGSLGQHRRLRVAVHGVCVLGEDAVHQPTAGGLRVARISPLPLLLHLRPVPQLPELLIVDDAPLQIHLPLPVLLQKLRRPAHLLLSDAGLLPRRLLRLAHGISPLPFVQNSFPVLTSPPTAAGSFPSCCTFPCNHPEIFPAFTVSPAYSADRPAPAVPSPPAGAG